MSDVSKEAQITQINFVADFLQEKCDFRGKNGTCREPASSTGQLINNLTYRNILLC